MYENIGKSATLSILIITLNNLSDEKARYRIHLSNYALKYKYQVYLEYMYLLNYQPDRPAPVIFRILMFEWRRYILTSSCINDLTFLCNSLNGSLNVWYDKGLGCLFKYRN